MPSKDDRVATPWSVVKSLNTLNGVLYGRGKGRRPPRGVRQDSQMTVAYREAKAAVKRFQGKRLPADKLAPILIKADERLQKAWVVLDDLQYEWAAGFAVNDWGRLAEILATSDLGVWAVWDPELFRNFPKAKEGVSKAYHFPDDGKGQVYVDFVRRNDRFLRAVEDRCAEIQRAGGLCVSVMFSDDGTEGGVVCPHLEVLVAAGAKVTSFLGVTAKQLEALGGIGGKKAVEIITARDAAVAAKEGRTSVADAADNGSVEPKAVETPAEEVPEVVGVGGTCD